MVSNYRLVWFQHFHKAAGSSVVQLAQQNGETLYPAHLNGQPLDEDGYYLRTWEYDAVGVRAFIDRCETIGVSFVSSEWGCPDFRMLASDARVVSITCLRDPFDRILSNYAYDYLNGYAKESSIRAYYEHHSLIFRQSNYYARLLGNGCGASPRDPNLLLRKAYANLDAIDICTVAENADPFSEFKTRLGWRIVRAHSNRTEKRAREIIEAARRGDYRSAFRQLFTKPFRSPDEVHRFKALFQSRNALDYEIYAHAYARANESVSTAIP